MATVNRLFDRVWGSETCQITMCSTTMKEKECSRLKGFCAWLDQEKRQGFRGGRMAATHGALELLVGYGDGSPARIPFLCRLIKPLVACRLGARSVQTVFPLQGYLASGYFELVFGFSL